MLLSVLLASFSCIIVQAVPNQAWVFTKKPTGAFVPKESFKLVDLGRVAALKDGEVRARVHTLGTAPTYRNSMDRIWKVGEPPKVSAVSLVVESRSSNFKKGDWITGQTPLMRSFRFMGGPGHGYRKVEVSKELPAIRQMSVLQVGGGLTAWHATEIVETGRVSKPCHKTIVVTSAASATGMIAGQLYKLKGCKVIGVTSTRTKADRVHALGGFDAVIAYKTENVDTRLTELAPKGVDLDFENVGGPVFSTILTHMNKNGRVVLCGAIHDYDRKYEDKYGMADLGIMIGKTIRMEGIFVTDLFPYLKGAMANMTALVKQGLLKSEETVMHGFDKWPEAQRAIFDSKNFGRMAVQVDAARPLDEL